MGTVGSRAKGLEGSRFSGCREVSWEDGGSQESEGRGSERRESGDQEAGQRAGGLEGVLYVVMRQFYSIQL
eukprot:441791-Hanusia_phi.AAC.1